MNHQVIARKHRPQFLRDLIGQESIVRILENSMRGQRLAHAYLLLGPRGVGKTSTARIMAMAFNAPGKPGSDYDPTCGEAALIAASRHPDVLELDAATHSGVERIRGLLEESAYAPTSLRYRVYLIDEVHMLSPAAFNALLKTLEEPPAQVKFILATTEYRKLPVTIKSRCQRLQLRLLPEELIARHLRHIAKTDGFSIDSTAAEIVAQASGGSMRDAQTLLEQLVAFTEGCVTEQAVIDLWGGMPRVQALTLLRAILTGKESEVWEIVKAHIKAGHDCIAAAKTLLDLLRQVQAEIYGPTSGTMETGLKNLVPPRKILAFHSRLADLFSHLEASLDPASLFLSWALAACGEATAPDLLDKIQALGEEERNMLARLLSR